MKPRIALVALVLGASLGSPTRADSVPHLISTGETLEMLAERYYGDPSWADGLRRYNGLDGGDPAEGDTVTVPVPDVHRVVPGDSWEALAARYWNDAGLGTALAALAETPDHALTPGQVLRVPALLPHAMQPGESLAGISRRLYGGPEKAEALASLNGIREPRRLAVGHVVRIPLLTVLESDASEPTRPDLESTPPAETRAVSAVPEDYRSFEVELREAASLYRRGRYEPAREQLEALLPDLLAEGSHAEQQQLFKQLALVYAAFGATEKLCTCYRALLMLDPDFTWDPDFTSPKIIHLTARCDDL